MRVNVNRKRVSSKLKNDPFWDSSKAWLKFKTAEGQRLRDKRHQSDKWKQKQIALQLERSGVPGISEVITLQVVIILFLNPFTGS